MRYGHCFYSTERWGRWSLVRSLLRSLAASACGGWSPTQGRPPGLHWMVVLHCSINVWMSRRWMNEWVNGWTCEGRIPPTISPAALGNLPGHGGKQPCPFWATTLWRSHSLSLSCHPLPPGYKWAPPYCPSSSPQRFHPPVGTHPPPGRGSLSWISAAVSAYGGLWCHCWVSQQEKGSCSGTETWRKMGWDQISILSQADVPPNLQAFVILLAVKERWNGALALIWIIISEAIFKST